MRSRSMFACALALSLFASRSEAAGSRWLVQTGEDFLEGEFDGVVLDAAGQLVAAPVHDEVWTTPDYYVWAMALDASGRLVAGSGDGGTIYRQGKEGLEAWTQTLALEILCLLPWKGGLLAGSSPDGVVFSVDADGHHEVALDIPQQSVWALEAGTAKDSWLAAAGPVARVVRVSPKAPAGEELYEFSATNATCLRRDGGTLWIGTQGPGLVYRVDGDDGDTARLVFEAPEDEVRQLVSDGAGGVFVLSVHSGSTTDDGDAAASRVTWLPATGGQETVFEAEERLLSLAELADGALLLGEAGTGRLLRLTLDGQTSVWAQLEGGDPLDILVHDDTCYVGTGNLGAVHRLDQGKGKDGQYTSVVLEAEHVEKWGRLLADPVGAGVKFSTRSGVRRTPDDTWTEWSEPRAVGSAVTSPAATFLQLRLTLPPQTAVTSVRVAYGERNLAPRVKTVDVESGGSPFAIGGINGSPPPVSQRFDDGLGVEYTVYQSRPKTQPDLVAWARGLRTVRWDADDPNDDVLRYHVEVRNLDGGEWLRVATDLEQAVYAWDTRSFDDGLYQVRIVAHDGLDNPASRRRSASADAAPVHVDNTPPRVRKLQWTRDGETPQVEAEVEDASSAITAVATRTDDGPWMPVEPEDGVLDGPTERFRFEPAPPPRPAGGDRVWLRVVDAAGNVNLKELAGER